MTDQETTPGIGDNSQLAKEIEAYITKAGETLDEIDTKREKLNAEANVIRTSLKEKGIDVRAFNAARNYKKTDPEKRATFDISYVTSRRALGLPIQGDLFGKK